MQKEAPRRGWFRRRGLFGKYVRSFVGLVVLVLVVNGGLETWFMYQETTQLSKKAQSEKAEAAARQIEQFVSEIERQISWATRASATTVEQRRSDYALLLQQVPAVDQGHSARWHRAKNSSGYLAGRSSSGAAPTTRTILGSRKPGVSRSGYRRSISMDPIRSCRLPCSIPGEMPDRPSPRSISSSCRTSSTPLRSARITMPTW